MTAPDTSTQSNILSAIKYAAGTDIGKRREENQDSFGVVENDQFRLFIVADGMGGVKGGAIASGLAIKVIEEGLKDKQELNAEIIKEAVAKANTQIFDRGAQDQGLAGMGTTLVGIAFVGLRMYLLNVGDSRLYRVRGGRIKQLSEDHTLVRELLKTGAITPDQAENHPVAHMLTRSLGPTPSVEIDCWLCDDGPARGDIYVLCSDGLYNLVGERDLLQLLREHSIDESIQRAIALANERGGTDNITAIMAQIGEDYPVGPEEFPEVEDSIGLEDTVELYLSRDQIAEAVDELETNGVDSSVAPSSETNASNPVIEGQIEIEKISPRDSGKQEKKSTTETKQQTQQSVSQSSALRKRVETGAVIAIALILGFFGRDWWTGNTEDAIKPQPQAVENPERPHDYSEITSPVQRNPDLAPEKLGLKLGIDNSHLVTSPPSLELLSLDGTGSEIAGAQSSGSFRGLSSRQLEDIVHRRDELTGVLNSIDQKLTFFNEPSGASFGDKLKTALKERQDLRAKMEQVQIEIDSTSRKLAVWYGRQKRLQTSDPVDLAAEVSVTSPAVREKKEIFERATWAYLQELEVLKYNPTDAAQEQKVKNLLKVRKERLAELASEVKEGIEKEARATDHSIAKLTLERDSLKDKLSVLEQEISHLQILTGNDNQAKLKVREELVKKKEVISAELQELNELLPQQ